MITTKLSPKAETIYAQLNTKAPKLGDVRTIAKDIKKDHELAMELWATCKFFPRLLAILILDKKMLTQEFIDTLDTDMQAHNYEERNQLMDWLMANQLMKDKKTIALMESWENSASALQRRIFWYYQARLRWVGQTPPANSEYLVKAIETGMGNEAPEVQWAMNLTAGWIGVYQPEYRTRCVALGERFCLYRGDMVSKGCTPSYLPEFIAMEAGKRNL